MNSGGILTVALDQEYGRTDLRFLDLFSNRKAGDDLFLTATGRIDVDKTSSDVLEQIKALLGTMRTISSSDSALRSTSKD